MFSTDVRRDAQRQPVTGERTAMGEGTARRERTAGVRIASGRPQRGRHRRPSTWRGAAAWLAGLPWRGWSLRASRAPAACGTAVAVLMLVGLVGVRRGAVRDREAGRQ
jgi:hypothetical protein